MELDRKEKKVTRTDFSCISGKNTIRGYFYCPEGDRLPIAIVCHGIMANLSTTKGYARFLAQIGYASFCFDFAGSGIDSRSDGSTTEMTVYTECEDLRAVIAYAGGLSVTDESRVTLMGCSQGGAVSALTAAETPQGVENLILFYPGFSIPDDARRGKMILAEFDPENIPETFSYGPMMLGRDYAKSVQDVDIFQAIAPYEGRVLIVHGSKDKIVKRSYVLKAEQVYKNASLKIIENAGHGFNEEEDRIALTYVAEFLSGT